MTMNAVVETNLAKCPDEEIANLLLNIPRSQMMILGKNIDSYRESVQEVNGKAAILRASLEQ
jgi:hypothetical protein